LAEEATPWEMWLRCELESNARESEESGLQALEDAPPQCRYGQRQRTEDQKGTGTVKKGRGNVKWAQGYP